MTWCWPSALKTGIVPIDAFLGDQLRCALGVLPSSVEAAIEEYWEAGEFLAAQKAAEKDPELSRTMQARIRQRKNDLRRAHEPLLQEAQDYRAHDELIASWLQEIERALDELRFQELPGLLTDLEGLVREGRALKDPIRLSLLEFVRAAGKEPGENAPRHDLQRQVDTLRSQNEMRRQEARTPRGRNDQDRDSRAERKR